VSEDSGGDGLWLLNVGQMGRPANDHKPGSPNPSGDFLATLGWRRLVFGARDHER